MYPNNQNGYNNGYPPNGGYNYTPPPFYRANGGFYGQPLWMDPRENKRREERRQIRKHMNWFGGASLLTLAFETVFMTLAVSVIMALGLNYSGFYETAAVYVIFSPLCIALPFIIASKACKVRISDVVTFEKHSPILGIGVFLLSFWGIAVGNIASDLLLSLLPVLKSSSEAASLPSANGPREIITQLLYASAVPALVEEFTFRGIVTGTCKRWGDKFAVVMGAAIFALVHGNLIQMPATFIAGLFMGYAYVRTGNLWTAVAIHFVNNEMSVFLSAFAGRFKFMNTVWFVLALYFVWAILGFLGFLLVKLHDRRLGSKPALKSYEGCLDPGGVAGVTASSPALIIAVAIYFFYAVGVNFLL